MRDLEVGGLGATCLLILVNCHVHKQCVIAFNLLTSNCRSHTTKRVI